MTEKKYLDATQEAGKAFYQRHIEGPVIMLNLLKFKSVADYAQTPALAPADEISGKEAYRLYMDYTMPFLKESGGELIFYGKGGHYLIGPEAERWDAILLVKHKSVATFMEFATNKEYLKGMGHRTAALEDSRLLPMEEKLFSR